MTIPLPILTQFIPESFFFYWWIFLCVGGIGLWVAFKVWRDR